MTRKNTLKQILKRTLSMVLALSIMLGLVPAFTITAGAVELLD